MRFNLKGSSYVCACLRASPCLLQAVKDSEPLRTAVDEVQPERVKLSLRLSQSKPLYEAFKGIKEGDLWGQLSEAQQRIVDGELRDFVLGGVALEVRYQQYQLQFPALALVVSGISHRFLGWLVLAVEDLFVLLTTENHSCNKLNSALSKETL